MKLSIITINYNNVEGLRKTMESVFFQTNKDFEYIVVDGASTDGSVEVIKELTSERANEFKNFKWVSEPDKGIYNAMNKGIEIAEGKRVVNSFNRSEFVEEKHSKADRVNKGGAENKGNEDGYVLMLNSGDYFVDEHVIERIMPELDGTDIVQGNNIDERANGVYRNRGYGKSDIDFFDVMKGQFLHQSSFCRRDLFDMYGYFDESYKVGADTKFFLNCLGRNDATFKYIDIDVSNYDLTGISADLSEKWVFCRQNEYNRIIKEVFSVRTFKFMLENEKKVRLYNDLHAHKWVWYLTMIVAHINNWFYKK